MYNFTLLENDRDDTKHHEEWHKQLTQSIRGRTEELLWHEKNYSGVGYDNLKPIYDSISISQHVISDAVAMAEASTTWLTATETAHWAKTESANNLKDPTQSFTSMKVLTSPDTSPWL